MTLPNVASDSLSLLASSRKNNDIDKKLNFEQRTSYIPDPATWKALKGFV